MSLTSAQHDLPTKVTFSYTLFICSSFNDASLATQTFNFEWEDERWTGKCSLHPEPAQYTTEARHMSSSSEQSVDVNFSLFEQHTFQ
jgi:hypothetical protein